MNTLFYKLLSNTIFIKQHQSNSQPQTSPAEPLKPIIPIKPRNLRLHSIPQTPKNPHQNPRRLAPLLRLEHIKYLRATQGQFLADNFVLEEIVYVAVRGVHAGYGERGAVAASVPVLVSVGVPVAGVFRVETEHKSIVVFKDRVACVGEG